MITKNLKGILSINIGLLKSLIYQVFPRYYQYTKKTFNLEFLISLNTTQLRSFSLYSLSDKNNQRVLFKPETLQTWKNR